MKSRKLIRLLKGIRQEEMHWLAKWLRSPYYNSDKSIVALFEYLRRYAPDYESTKLTKEQVFDHVFPGEHFNDRRLRVTMSRLSGLVEAFMVAQRLKRDSFSFEQHLHTELGARNLYDLFAKKNRELSKKLEESPYRDADHYLARWRVMHDHFFQLQTRRYQVQAAQLDEIMQQLDAFFLLSKLRYSAELLNRQNILSEEHELLLLPESRQLVAESPRYKNNKVFQMYDDLLGLMEQPENEVLFQRLYENVIQNLQLFRPEDQAMFLRYLINVTIRLYNKGKQAYLSAQFTLFLLGLQHDIFFTKGKFSDATFLNVIVTATVLGKLDWVESFIAEYAPLLAEEMQADAINLGTAYWYFAKQNFTSSKKLLRQIEGSDLQYLLRIKSLALRNDFELFLQDESYFELFDYESSALEKFLRRDKRLSEERIQAYIQFILVLRKLAKQKTNFQLTAGKLEELQQRLKAQESIIARHWLMEKVEYLKRGA